MRRHLLSEQYYFLPMQGVVMVMPISEATGQVVHMHSILPIFWDSQVIIPSMLQNMPILEAMEGSMQEFLEEEVIFQVSVGL